MIPQRGIAVVITQPQPHQSDQLRALDGFLGILRQDLGKDVSELFA